MTRRELINALYDFNHENENEWNKDVIVIVEGQDMPYPDIVGIDPPNEDTVILKARK